MVRFFYHCLGATAKANSTLARYWVGLFRFDILLILALTGFCASLWESAVDAMRNSQTPLPVSLEQIRTNSGIIQNYVQVSGLAAPITVYEDTETWFPLVDVENKSVLLIRTSGIVEPGDAHLASFTGMLTRLHAEVRNRLAAKNNRIDGLPVETKYELAEGDRPGDPWRTAVAAGFMSFVLGCFCIVWFKRNIVFQRGGHFATPLANIPRQPIPVRATGRFAFDAQTTKRFVDVPAILTFDQGRYVLMSRIDASERWMGTTINKRAGVWRMFVKQGTLKDGRFGFQFFGLSRRPAFKFCYLDSRGDKKCTGVIAADEPKYVVMSAASLAGFGSNK